MKILAKYMSATGQVHNGKCYFIGMVGTGGAQRKANNIEASGTAAVGNQVGWIHDDGSNVLILPKPGVECSNGLYINGGDVLVFYSLG